jgi:hypothetical protein
METKLAKLEAAYRSGNQREALRIAAKFPRLGEHKEPITRAWAAIQSPDFYRAIGQDPESLVADGVKALQVRYSL